MHHFQFVRTVFQHQRQRQQSYWVPVWSFQVPNLKVMHQQQFKPVQDRNIYKSRYSLSHSSEQECKKKIYKYDSIINKNHKKNLQGKQKRLLSKKINYAPNTSGQHFIWRENEILVQPRGWGGGIFTSVIQRFLTIKRSKSCKLFGNSFSNPLDLNSDSLRNVKKNKLLPNSVESLREVL